MDAGEGDEACFKDFVEFCLEMWSLTCQRQFMMSGLITTGSHVELPSDCYIENATDTDMMFEFPYMLALPPGVNVDSVNVGTTVFRIDTDGVHIGFARLIREDGKYLANLYKIPLILKADEKQEGPALTSNQRKISEYLKLPSTIQSKVSSVDQNSVTNLKTLHDSPIDVVPCIRCPYWPNEAVEWTRRQRRSGWPSTTLVDEVVRTGCHFVFVAHKLSTAKYKEFRFSFSTAEALIISSMSPAQIKVYHMLKLMAKHVKELLGGAKLLLCSYYLKTLVLWSCEEKPSQFWEEDRIANSTRTLWLCVIGWMRQKRCPNYFIPSNNMMDHIDMDSLRYDRELEFLNVSVESVMSIIPALISKIVRYRCRPGTLIVGICQRTCCNRHTLVSFSTFRIIYPTWRGRL